VDWFTDKWSYQLNIFRTKIIYQFIGGTNLNCKSWDLQMLWIAKIFRWFFTLNRQGKFESRFPGKVSLKFDEDQHEMNNLVKWPFQWPFWRLSDLQRSGSKSYFEFPGNNIQLHFRKKMWKDKEALVWDASLSTNLVSHLFGYLVDVMLYTERIWFELMLQAVHFGRLPDLRYFLIICTRRRSWQPKLATPQKTPQDLLFKGCWGGVIFFGPKRGSLW